ncbi:hypothetical protein K461DRAFT_107525 [Myriangium duriaei CBS 260.36]|uniref:Uncharacterized protein n=1 Tax=Myriangium duriaei CBS 260.36 TaxID=1168546 RepID=A0A9P4J449_9PEZI|nr:hypothetical protein K461DRAFT_107525 [Myriangium duriaei CBS 260.36]
MRWRKSSIRARPHETRQARRTEHRKERELRGKHGAIAIAMSTSMSILGQHVSPYPHNTQETPPSRPPSTMNGERTSAMAHAPRSYLNTPRPSPAPTLFASPSSSRVNHRSTRPR